MTGWRDIKAKVRGLVHSTFQVPAIYLTHVEGVPVSCAVRVHTKIVTTENENASGYQEIDPYVIFNADEVPDPLGKAYVIIDKDEIYRIGVAEPRREGFIKASVTVLTATECAALMSALPATISGVLSLFIVTVRSGADRDIKVVFPEEMWPVGNPKIIMPVGPNGAPAIETRLTAGLIDGAAGEVNVELDGTDPLPVGEYSFRVQITKLNGRTEASGKVTINVV